MISLRMINITAAVLLSSLQLSTPRAFGKSETSPARDSLSAVEKSSVATVISGDDWAVFLEAFRTKLRREGFSELHAEERIGNGLTGKFTVPRPADCAVIVIGTDSSLTATVRQPDGSKGSLGALKANGGVYSIITSNRVGAGTYEVSARYASGKNDRIALLAGIQKVSGADDWSAVNDVVRGEFGKNGYTIIIDSTAATSKLSIKYSLAGPGSGVLMGWAVVSNNNSVSVSVKAPDGRTTPLGGAVPSSGFHINMNYAPAKHGDYVLTAETGGGSADKIMVLIGSKSGD